MKGTFEYNGTLKLRIEPGHPLESSFLREMADLASKGATVKLSNTSPDYDHGPEEEFTFEVAK